MEERRNGSSLEDCRVGGLLRVGKTFCFKVASVKSENIRVSLKTIWSRIGAQHVSDPDPNII